jgi:hypothetical protein
MEGEGVEGEGEGRGRGRGYSRNKNSKHIAFSFKCRRMHQKAAEHCEQAAKSSSNCGVQRPKARAK